jgi:hypothetical protein
LVIGRPSSRTDLLVLAVELRSGRCLAKIPGILRIALYVPVLLATDIGDEPQEAQLISDTIAILSVYDQRPVIKLDKTVLPSN